MDVVGAAIDVTVAMHLWGRRQTHPDDGDRAPRADRAAAASTTEGVHNLSAN
jgi:hypothetical protein